MGIQCATDYRHEQNTTDIQNRVNSETMIMLDNNHRNDGQRFNMRQMNYYMSEETVERGRCMVPGTTETMRHSPQKTGVQQHMSWRWPRRSRPDRFGGLGVPWSRDSRHISKILVRARIVDAVTIVHRHPGATPDEPELGSFYPCNGMLYEYSG